MIDKSQMHCHQELFLQTGHVMPLQGHHAHFGTWHPRGGSALAQCLFLSLVKLQMFPSGFQEPTRAYIAEETCTRMMKLDGRSHLPLRTAGNVLPIHTGMHLEWTVSVPRIAMRMGSGSPGPARTPG